MSEQKVGEVISIVDLKVPPVLYKYREFGKGFHEKALFEQQLYIPSAKEFNDPYDSKIPFRYKDEELTEENIYKKCLQIAHTTRQGLPEEQYQAIAYRMAQEGSLNDAHHLEKFDKISFERLCNEYGIFCLTPDTENVLMWSYYGNSHSGFTIGYNSEYLVRCGLFGMGGKVLYRDDFPKIPLFWDKEDYPMLNTLFTKWTKWRHEDEYRLIHRYGHGKVHQLPPEAISEITFGSEVSEERKVAYTEQILKSLPKARIYQVELNKNGFGLKRVQVFDDNLLIQFVK
jgi:hypothetical protein